MSVLYPIAADAEAALRAPLGRAVREREAGALAGQAVAFARELTGPAFATREAAEAAYAGIVDAPGAPPVPSEDRFCELMEVLEKPGAGGQAEPVCADGRRWPAPRALLKTVWRLSVSYWRLAAEAADADLPQARQARRSGEGLDAQALRAMARQPLQPVKPQQPLDIGLFEVRLPEAPDTIVPDE